MIQLIAPVKINLTLEIGKKRPDNYHDLTSLVIFGDFGDDLIITHQSTPFSPAQKTPGDLHLTLEGNYSPQDQGFMSHNLCSRALKLFHEQVHSLRDFWHIHLSKKIPVQAGLGGGSSDAGTILRYLAKQYDIRLEDERLQKIARELGSDVPVCLYGTSAIMQGRGEHVYPLPEKLPDFYLLLVNPGISVSTPTVFKALSQMRSMKNIPPQNSLTIEHILSELRSYSFDDLISYMKSHVNHFEDILCQIEPCIQTLLENLCDLPGCVLARMSGSGSSCYAIFKTHEQVKNALRLMTNRYPSFFIRQLQLI